MNAAAIQWIDASKQLPDPAATVLLALPDGEVWTGFHIDGEWRFVSADLIESPPLYWAAFPEPPQVKP
jgi:hypothetical protein